MIIECTECGAKNQTTQPTQSGKRYRCGKCGASIIFLQNSDTPNETTSTPIMSRTSNLSVERASGRVPSSVLPKVSSIPFESGHSRAQWVTFFLAVLVIVGVVSVWFDYMQIDLINRIISLDFFTMAEVYASDDRQATIGFIYLLVFAISGILFLMWIHRAHRNLPSLGISNLKYSPGWAVGWFFVPIMSIWMPYRVTTEIWKASDPINDINDSTAWQKSPASSLVSIWWFLFIVAAFIGNFLIRSFWQADTPSEILTVSWWGLIIDIIDIVIVILTIVIVRNIDQRQQIKIQRVKTPLTY